MRKIRILHVFNKLNNGGIENLVMSVMRKIDRDRFQFCFALIEDEKGYFDDEVRELGGEIYLFDCTKKTIKNYRNSLNRIISENGPFDVVHSHCYFFSGIVLGIAKKCGIKIRIAHAHDTQKGRKQTLARRTYQSVMRILIHKNATEMIGCSDVACAYVFGSDDNYRVIYNGIDTTRFRFDEQQRIEMRDNLCLADKTVFIHVGRFAEQKNHSYLLRVFDRYSKKDSNAVLMLLGNGALEKRVRDQAESLGLTDKVIFIGATTTPELYYNAADCFLMPSLYEGLGIVAVEAQCNGLPCLISDRVTQEVRIATTTQYIGIEDDKIEQWVNAMLLIKENLYADRTRAVNIIENSNFDIKQTVKSLEHIYSRIN